MVIIEILNPPKHINKVNLISVTHFKSDPHSNFHSFMFSLTALLMQIILNSLKITTVFQAVLVTQISKFSRDKVFLIFPGGPWLGLWLLTAEYLGSILVQGTKISQAMCPKANKQAKKKKKISNLCFAIFRMVGVLVEFTPL